MNSELDVIQCIENNVDWGIPTRSCSLTKGGRVTVKNMYSTVQNKFGPLLFLLLKKMKSVLVQSSISHSRKFVIGQSLVPLDDARVCHHPGGNNEKQFMRVEGLL